MSYKLAEHRRLYGKKVFGHITDWNEVVAERRGRDALVAGALRKMEDQISLSEHTGGEGICVDCLERAVALLKQVLEIDGWKK